MGALSFYIVRGKIKGREIRGLKGGRKKRKKQGHEKGRRNRETLRKNWERGVRSSPWLGAISESEIPGDNVAVERVLRGRGGGVERRRHLGKASLHWPGGGLPFQGLNWVGKKGRARVRWSVDVERGGEARREGSNHPRGEGS